MAADPQCRLTVAEAGTGPVDSGIGDDVFYGNDAGDWSVPQKLEPDADDPGEDFGTSLALMNGTLIVGAPKGNRRPLHPSAQPKGSWTRTRW